MPMVAQAEVPLAPEKMPEATIQAAIRDFADPWCKTGFQGLVDNVKKCFKETSENSPDIDKCVIGHYTLYYTTRYLQEYSHERGLEDPTQNISFVGRQMTHDRGVHYINLPRYKNVKASDYIGDPAIINFKKIRADLKECPAN